MKKWLLLVLIGFASMDAKAIPVISNASVDFISHGTVRLRFNQSETPFRFRIRISSGASCAAGSGGYVQQGVEGAGVGTNAGWIVGGLLSDTMYHTCIEASSDGVTYSTGTEITFTTTALPAVHPALPIAPLAFDTSMPDTSAYTKLVVGVDCDDLNACIDTALLGQCSHGYLIILPDGTQVNDIQNIVFTRQPCDTIHFQYTDVSTTTERIHIPSHGLTEGQTIQFGGFYGPDYPHTTSCQYGTGISQGQSFYVHRVDADNIQVYCADRTTLMDFTTQGFASSYLAIAAHPRDSLNWIVIGSSTALNSPTKFVPEKTRVSPSWLPKMASLVDPLVNWGNDGFAHSFLNLGSTDGNETYLISKVRFVGLEITTEDAAGAHTSSDPYAWFMLIDQGPTDSNIIFDRCYIHGQGTPNRMNRNIFWDGYNVAFVDSYFDNLVWFHTKTSSGLTKDDSTHFSVGAGAGNGGSGQTSIPAFTATISGSATGKAFVYLNMANSNAITISAPTGMTFSCSGATCVTGSTTTSAGSCSLDDRSAGWPKDVYGNPSAVAIGCVNVTAGSISSVENSNNFGSFNTEGCNAVIAGQGPGPYKVENNHIEGAGLTWHFDDGGGSTRVRGDYTWHHNYVHFPLRYLYAPWNTASDGLFYSVRQPLEWKSGQRADISGNIFDTTYDNNDTVAGFITITSVAGQGDTDFNIHDNTFKHGPNVFQLPDITAGGANVMTPPFARIAVKNNLAYDIDGAFYYSPEVVAGGNSWYFEGPSGVEDFVIDHNSFIGSGGGGRAPAMFWTFGFYEEGFQYTNNFSYLWSGTKGMAQDGGAGGPCGGLLGQEQADCLFRPAAQTLIANNVFQSGDSSSSTVAGWWPSGLNIIPGDTALAHNKYFSYVVSGDTGNYHLRHDSPYISGGASHGSDGKSIGADIDKIENAEGLVNSVGVNSITSSAATVSFVAPDSQACSVDYAPSSDVITSFTRAADSGTAAGPRNVSLSGLSSHTVYHFRINCAVEQPSGQFVTI